MFSLLDFLKINLTETKDDGNVCFYNGYNGRKDVPKNIQKVVVKDGVQYIEDGAFEYCRSLSSIHLPSSVISIGKYAFYDCMSLKSIRIPSSVTFIGRAAFEGCTSLTFIQLPSQIKEIQPMTFSYCSSLISIDLSSSLTEIHDAAFRCCESLQSMKFPPLLTCIGHRAFYGNISLTTITLRSDILFIGRNAFEDCKSLRTIYIQSTVTQSDNHNALGTSKDVEISTQQVAETSSRLDCISPLHFLLMFGSVLNYDDEIGPLIIAEPDSLAICDPIYNMYPFLLAACTPRRNDKKNNDVEDQLENDFVLIREIRHKQHLETVFVLLRQAPWVMDILITK